MSAHPQCASVMSAVSGWDMYSQVDDELTLLGTYMGTHEEAIERARTIAYLPHLIACVFIVRAGSIPAAPRPRFAVALPKTTGIW